MGSFLFLIMLCFVCDGALFSPSLYSLEWSSSVPLDDVLEGDNFLIREISLYANDAKINITPTTTNIDNVAGLSDGSYEAPEGVAHFDSVCPAGSCDFTVRFDFDGLQPTDYLKLYTNCGDAEPSRFCQGTTFATNVG